MIARRRSFAASLVVMASVVAAACNAIIGAPDRVLDEGDGAPLPDRRPSRPETDALAPAEAGPAVDAGPDAEGGVTIAIGTDWASPNGAEWVVDGGTTITKFTATHPIIVPRVQPDIPSEDYTVLATVYAPKAAEFGVLTRVQADGAAMLIGSMFGGEPRPFMGRIDPPEWNPSDDGRGTSYTFVAGARYHFKLRATGNQVAGKMWESSQPEPPAFQVTVTAPWATGRGAGFYTYGLTGAVLEKLAITVP